VSDDQPSPAADLGTIRRSFDAVADSYARQFVDELDRKPFDSALLDRLSEALPSGAAVLDLGCGAAGHIGRYLHDRGCRVTGVDFSERSIETARQVQPDLEFVVADFRRLPFDDGSIDGIVAFYSLIYGSDTDVVAALAEGRRVLRRGGRLLAAVHGDPDGVPRSHHFEDFDGTAVDITMRYTTPATVAGLAERAGLRLDEIHAREPYEFEHTSRRIYLLASAP